MIIIIIIIIIITIIIIIIIITRLNLIFQTLRHYYPANIYLFLVNYRNSMKYGKRVKYVQS